MRKQVVITCLALALIGCQPYSREATKEYELPKALEHCTVHEISNGQLRELYVVLCPGKLLLPRSKTASTQRTFP